MRNPSARNISRSAHSHKLIEHIMIGFVLQLDDNLYSVSFAIPNKLRIKHSGLLHFNWVAYIL